MTTTCPYCRSGLDEPALVVHCARCGSPHHSPCWELNGECSVYGCRTLAVRSKITWSVLPIAILLFGLIPPVRQAFLFLFLPLLLYTIAAIGAAFRNIHHA